MPAQVTIELSAEERKQLDQNIRSQKTPVRLLERSRIVLFAAQRIPNYKIAETLNIDVNKVGRWRKRFAANRHQGIEKEGLSGLPKRFFIEEPSS